MNKFEIFTDSSCDLTDGIITKYNINVVSLTFMVQNEEYNCYSKGNVGDVKMFYDLLRKKENLTTSCVNSDTFITAFTKTLIEGYDILYIGFSSGLSGTYAAAELAASKLRSKFPKQKILCVDSRGGCLGEGLLVLYAAIQREKGKTLAEAYKWQMDNLLMISHLFTVDDLFFIFRGGRLNRAKYMIGNLINIKPILYADETGVIMQQRKVIGRKKSILTIADLLVQTIDKSEEQIVAIAHADCLEDAMLLKDKIGDKIKVKEWIINYIDPVMGTHGGPGTLAVFFKSATSR
ncbi:MAG: DegV family protein [Clostridia bacterium]